LTFFCLDSRRRRQNTEEDVEEEEEKEEEEYRKKKREDYRKEMMLQHPQLQNFTHHQHYLHQSPIQASRHLHSTAEIKTKEVLSLWEFENFAHFISSVEKQRSSSLPQELLPIKMEPLDDDHTHYEPPIHEASNQKAE